jgi:phosphoenolpyruvate carboxykinase (GTP)
MGEKERQPMTLRPSSSPSSTDHEALRNWVDSVAQVTKPDRIMYCTGSEEENRLLIDHMLTTGELLALNAEKYPNCFLHRSNPTDVARTEHLTFICSPHKDDVGPTNNWMSKEDAQQKVWPRFSGAMRGRTLYVVPYLMGPVGSPSSRVGVEITDSAYVVVNMRIMTRMGQAALDHLARFGGGFVKGLHSLGDLSPDRRFICHFPAEREIWSIGSGYGGNALLGKKCHALRLASVIGRDEGWMAEHMLILGIEDLRPGKHGEVTYIAAAFPSACGKTNLAMLVPSLGLQGQFRIHTVGDDICWMHIGPDGRLWAINPEAGFFGVAPGTGQKTNPNALATLQKNSIFTNVAVTENNEPWWEGLSPAPERLTDWQGRPWTPAGKEKAAHPNSRFTAPARQCPCVSPQFEAPQGVPISAIMFGGRRARLMPLVVQAKSWQHGVYLGATLSSETTAAAVGAVGVVRHDPMAMLPFCGYNMADYFAHWLSMAQRTSPDKLPQIFQVNWFRMSREGHYLWPGFGENARVLKWIVDRVHGAAPAVQDTPIGTLPAPGTLDLASLGLSESAERELLLVDPAEWQEESLRHKAFLAQFGSRTPAALWQEHATLVDRLSTST